MPYSIYKRNNQYCVHKKKGDGSAGKKIACHATMTKAKAQVRALHASEKKELEMPPNKEDAAVKVELDVTDELKETVDKLEEKHTYDYVPWGVYSFADLEKAQDARAQALRVKTLSDQFVEIVSNIMASDEIEDKSAAVSSLSSEYSQLINKSDTKEQPEQGWLADITKTVKETMENIFSQKPKQTSGFMMWKEGNRLRWLTRYSTNFRDDDNPPEIISGKSHQRFVDMVDKKEAPMPELWLWHVPEWKLGEADWLAYDDSGFALASGTIDRGKEIVAEQIAKQKLVGVSHGMPVSSIERDPDDPTIIVSHISAEISPLPHSSAANKMAAWVLLGDTTKEGNNMPIPDKKKRALVDEWNMDPALLEQLESINSQDAEKATEEGIESKEVDTEETEQVEETEVAEEAATDEVEAEEETTEVEQTDEPDDTPVENPPSREEIADAIATVLKPYVELTEELQGQIKELKKSDEEKVSKAAAMTPSASVSAILAKQFSAIGDKESQIDGRSSLAQSTPEEAEDDQVKAVTPVPFINEMIAGKSEDDAE
jgi:hypothetical protein